MGKPGIPCKRVYKLSCFAPAVSHASGITVSWKLYSWQVYLILSWYLQFMLPSSQNAVLYLFFNLDFQHPGTNGKLSRHLFHVQTMSLHTNLCYLYIQSLYKPVAKYNIFPLCSVSGIF